MRNRIVWVVLSCLLAAVMVLTSCGPAEEAKEAAKEVEVTPAVQEPQYGGTLTYISYGTTPYAWDPADCDWYQAYICGPVYENLMMGDIQKGPRGTNEFPFNHAEWIPDEFLTGQLAESWETVAPNKIIWYMRKGIMWTGKPGVMTSREVTAYDAEAALKRYMVSPKSSVGRFNWVDSLTATDKYTLVLEYNAFSADWSYLLGWGWSTDIYPPEVVTAGIGDWKNIVGTGPFMIEDYVTGSSITYTRNPGYWGTTMIDGKEYETPFVDTMIYLIIADESTRLAAVRTAKVDTATQSWKFKATLEESNPELKRWRLLSMSDLLVAMPVDKEPFDDIRVRQAMSMALDRNAISKNPEWEPTDNPIFLHYPMGGNYPESVYTPLEKLPADVAEQFTLNITKAKQLLTDAGYPNGFKTEMILDNTTPTMGDIGSQLTAMWLNIGVTVDIKPMEYSAFQSMFLSKTNPAMVFYSKGLVHPLTALRYNLPGQPWGPANWNDPQYEKDYYIAKGTVDDAERNKILKALNVQALAAVGYIGMPANYYYVYAQPWVMNYYGETNLGYINEPSQAYAAIWIDQAKKAELGY
ncbi:MAG: ABC transporter substrate-binding protein [Dehalococcoidales bacterium]|nr:ABC transporter substrate-binding protein [Dehalococcoidales bacterium]